MRVTCKLLNSLLLLSTVSISLAQNNLTVLDSISMALHPEGGIQIEATLEQNQNENIWTDYISVEILDSTKFIFIGSDQIIKVDNDTIFTYKSNTNQIVIDRYYRDEFNLLSLISGNLYQVDLGEVQRRVRDSIVNFTIPHMESRGRIWINSETYYPMRILLEDDLENSSAITIDEIEPLGIQPRYNDYYIDGWEIIDLRE